MTVALTFDVIGELVSSYIQFFMSVKINSKAAESVGASC